VATAPLSPPGGAAPTPGRLVAKVDPYVLAVMALMAVVARIGSRRLRDAVVAAVAELAFRLSREKRRGSEAALARAFGPRLGERRRRTILRRAFREFWADVFALRPLRGAPPDAAEVVGEEHLRDALAGGRGAILWVSNHWAGMSTLKRALHARGLPIHKVHAENHLGGFPGYGDTWVERRFITPYFDRHEAAVVAGIVRIRAGSLSVARDLATRLRANAVVCVAADGHLGRRFVPVRLLGFDDAFATGAVTLARSSGAPLLPVFCLPGPGHATRVVIEPAIALPADRDREALTRHAFDRYVEHLERRARRHPSRYLNWHLLGRAVPPTSPR
jgi:lauroyl/myristoyl acyltransferase